jgi:subtilisin
MPFEPPRGPANVSRLPLNPGPLMFQTERGGEAGIHGLNAAMALAGLAAGR